MLQDWKVSLKSVTDGTSKTLMIGERWYNARAWMIGAYTSGTSSEPYGGDGRGAAVLQPSGPQAEVAWFSCKNITDKVPLNVNIYQHCYFGHLNDYSTGANPHPGGDRPAVDTSVCTPVGVGFSCNNMPFGSFHPGGVDFALGDGSVRFLRDDLDMPTYLAMGSRNGGETLTDQ
jgi:hypothetical protein